MSQNQSPYYHIKSQYHTTTKKLRPHQPNLTTSQCEDQGINTCLDSILSRLNVAQD